jgi:hypothetical protein
MPPKYGQIQIEITSSETQMKYFTENLSRRLPRLIWRLNNQMMFDDDAQADHFREIGNDLEVVLLTRNLFMVMFDSTIYFFRIDFEYEVFWFKLPLWKLNQTTYRDYDQGIRDLSRRFDSFRFFTDLEVYDDDHVDFDVFSDVFNQGNSCVRASVTIHFDDDDDTLETRVICSRRLFSRGVDDSPFSSTTDPDFEETDFSDKKLRIRDEGLDEDDSDDDEQKVKIVNVNLDYPKECDIDIDNESESEDEIIDEPEAGIVSLDEAETIVVNKVDSPKNAVSKDELQKMSPATLKSLLVSKGQNAESVGKMKKKELVDMLFAL